MNPDDAYIEDTDELIFTGKKIRKYRDTCRTEGYKQALEDVLNLPLKDFTGDYLKGVYELKKECEKK